MDIKQGRWEDQKDPQRDANGEVKLDRFGNPLVTRYLKGISERDEERIRNRMKNLIESMNTSVKSMGSWELVQHELFPGEKTVPRIGNDPKRYTLEQIVTDMHKHLNSKQSNGRPKDITQSFVNRYNALLEAWYNADSTLTPEDFDNRYINIIEPTPFGEKLKEYFE